MGLSLELQDMLNDYFIRHPNMSLNGLAQRSQVAATTLRRISNNTIKGGPSPHTVLNLVSAISREKRLSRLVEMHDGEIGKMLKQVFGPYVEMSSEHLYLEDLNELLRDRIYYFIYKLAANSAGVAKIEVKELFGNLGLEKLQKLSDLQFLKQKQGRFHARDKNFSLDVEVAVRHMPEMISFYRAQDVAKGKNLFYTLSESLNEEGIQKVKEAQKQAVMKTHEIMNNPEYHGFHHYFTLQICDRFTVAANERELYQ